MYKFKEEINQESFFRFEKKLITSGEWAALPKASKAIYPVIGVHCDKQGTAFPSQDTIAILAGCTQKTVRVGLQGLEQAHRIETKKTITARGRYLCKYKIPLPSRHKGVAARFYKAFIEGGNWRLLSKGAQAVYPVLLAVSYFDYETYWEMQNEVADLSPSRFFEDGLYVDRDFDIARPEMSVVAEYAGVCQNTVLKAYRELEDKAFIQGAGTSSPFMVFRLPKHVYCPKHLNDSIRISRTTP